MLNPIFVSGLQGIHKALENAANNASKITRAFTPESTEDPVPAMIGLKQNLREVQANVKVIKVADELDDAVLDILA